MKTKVLVDGTPLSVGGGVQVAIAFLTNLVASADFEWRALLPETLRVALPARLLKDSRILFLRKTHWHHKLVIGLAVRKEVAKFDPDVVFTVFGPPYFITNKPHVIGFALPRLIYPGTMGWLEWCRRWLSDGLRARLFLGASLIVVETETVKRLCVDILGYDASKIRVVPNAVNPSLLCYSPTEIRGAKFEIFVPAAYYKHKNLEIVPAVAAEIARRNRDLHFSFSLTLPPESPGWKSVDRVSCKLGVQSKVTTLGSLGLDSLASAYQRCHAVFLPTLFEASTAVYPEAFYFRRPLVTSDLPFARELCGDAALFVDPNDYCSAAEVLLKLRASPDLAKALVAEGENRLKSGYVDTARQFCLQSQIFREAVALDRKKGLS